ncbi:MAG: oligoendopeptidase F [Bacillota bacterium]
MNKELPEREQIDEQFKWNLEDIFASDEDWEQEYQAVTDELSDILQLEGKLVESGEQLFNGLEKIMSIQARASRVHAYAHMKQDQDTSNQQYQALNARAQELYHNLNDATSFVVPEILKLDRGQLAEYMEQTPGLEKYEHFLDNILRQRQHYLSRNEEKLLAMAGEVASGPSNIFTMLNNADLTFPLMEDEDGEEIRITHGRFIELMKSRARRVRREAFEKLYEKYGELENTFASTLNSSVKGHIYYARARNYDSALEYALDDDNVPVMVYDNLISTIKDNLEPLHRYVELRQRELGLEELHMYDLYTPLIPEVEIQITYQEAREKVKQGLKPLGRDYLKLLEEGFESGWIDVYENRGKRSGAYSSGCYGVHPYVLLNYTRDVSNMFTLAHEMGHALHTYFSNQNQPYVYSEYKIFVAEVASTLNETLLLHHLLQTTDSEAKRLFYINHYLEQFRATVYRQTMFAEFEREIHSRQEQGVPLTPSLLKELYRELNREYYGPEVVLDQQIDLEWARIPHFYYNFYVYKYATGFSAATAIAAKILRKGQPAVADYLEFLKSGDADYPLQLLKIAGVDLQSPQPIRKAIGVFEDYLDQFEQDLS